MTAKKVRSVGVCVIVLTWLAPCFPTATAQRVDKECQPLIKQINDLVDKLADVSERMGAVENRLDHSEAVDQNKRNIENEKAIIRKRKVTIDKLMGKLCLCCSKRSGAAPPQGKECQSIMKQANDLVDKIAEVGERMGMVQDRLDRGEAIDQNKLNIENEKAIIQKNKVTFDKLLYKLCDCCSKKAPDSVGLKETPTPSKPPPIFVRNYQPGEVFAGYMFLRAPGETAKNSSGFAVQLFYNFKPNLGIGGDLACAWGSGRLGTTVDVRLQRCTYTFGPQINTKPNGKVQFFFHPLVGGVHDANKTTAGTLISESSANALMLSIGGGFNLKMNPRVAVRPIQVDYQPTHFGGSWHSNWRLGAGIIFRFGDKK